MNMMQAISKKSDQVWQKKFFLGFFPNKMLPNTTCTRFFRKTTYGFKLIRKVKKWVWGIKVFFRPKKHLLQTLRNFSDISFSLLWNDANTGNFRKTTYGFKLIRKVKKWVWGIKVFFRPKKHLFQTFLSR